MVEKKYPWSGKAFKIAVGTLDELYRAGRNAVKVDTYLDLDNGTLLVVLPEEGQEFKEFKIKLD